MVAWLLNSNPFFNDVDCANLDISSMLARLVIPMSAGSIFGAMVGGYAAQWAPTDLLRAILAVILAASAFKLFRSH